MIKIIKHAVSKHAWLFFAAAWVYTLSFIFTNYFSYSSSAEKVARILKEYVHGQENSFKNVLDDTAIVSAIINDAPSLLKKQLFSDAQGIFAYQVNDMGNPVKIFWNTNKMSPGNDDILKPDGSYLVNYQNGVFELVKTSFTRNHANYFFVTLIPIRWQYSLEGEYLQSHFAVNEAIDKEYAIAPAGQGTPVINSTGKTLFGVREINQRNDSPAGFSIFLRILAVAFFIVFINNVAAETGRKRNFRTGFIVLITAFLAFRLIIYFLPFPFDYREMNLFDSKHYNGGIINRSLGDLLLNALLSLWALTFFRKKINATAVELLRDFAVGYKVLTFASFFLIPATSFYFANVISGLVIHSKISFNAADFFSLSLLSLTSFIIICIVLYIWLYVTGIFVQLAAQTKLPLFWQYITILAFSFLLISLHIFSTDGKLSLIITGFILLIIAFIRYRDNPSFSSLVSSSYFIVWALIVTAAASALIVYENNTTEKENRIKKAISLQEQTDSSGTRLVHLAINNFSDKFLQNNFYRFKNARNNEYLKDSLINKNLPAYITKYNTTIYLFDNNHLPLYNEDSTTYTIITSTLENRSKPTTIKGLYSYRNKEDNYNYVYAKDIVKDSVYLGSLFVHIQPRLLENTKMVPELFKQKDNGTGLTESNYQYGVYNNNKLVSAFVNFNFPDSIAANEIPKTGYYFKDSSGYSQLWYNTGNSKMLIIAKKNESFSSFITLFSYLFVLFIILSFVVHNSRILLENRGSTFSFRNLFRFNIRTQIQATIVGVSIVSFLIIGIATISFFILKFKKNTKNELGNVSQIMAGEIEQALKSEIINNDPPDFIDFGSGGELDKKILDIASIHNADVNFFAKNGVLLLSSQSIIYNQQIVSNRMNPEAFYALHYNQSTRFTQKEKIGSFSFESVYIPIKDEKETIAYLNTPTLSAQNELKEEISDFLVTLIILNALIFIFAGAISVALTGRITSSLEFIGGKMKEIKIGAANEEIPWQRNDEIGMLVNEYNKMVKQLEQSVQALAKSEREGAWREMARQVAHEIKNPLTPMKLSIQYLQRAMEDNTPNAVDLSKKLASTLIEQIDQLSKIASDFSQFANIENIKPERFNISVLIQNLVNLYRADSSLLINYTTESNNAEVFSDKAQINRLFTNLIKNAIEAYDETETPRIQISQYMQLSDVIIAVTDYGSGIHESLRTKIFNPNFTTKSSGTGLGLAICKAIVENAAGRIWFTTSEGAGTSFYVKLPLADVTQPGLEQPV